MNAKITFKIMFKYGHSMSCCNNDFIKIKMFSPEKVFKILNARCILIYD